MQIKEDGDGLRLGHIYSFNGIIFIIEDWRTSIHSRMFVTRIDGNTKSITKYNLNETRLLVCEKQIFLE